MKASTAAVAAALALSSAGMAAEITGIRAAAELAQSTPLSPNVGRVEVCTLDVEGSDQPCQSFDARQLETFLIAMPTSSAPTYQLAFIDPVSHLPVAPTQDQLSELRGFTLSEETQSDNNEMLITEFLADGTMMVRVGNHFHAQLSVIRSNEPPTGRTLLEAVKP